MESDRLLPPDGNKRQVLFTVGKNPLVFSIENNITLYYGGKEQL